MKLILKDNLIYAPVKEEFGDEPETLLCEHSEEGEAIVPHGPGEDLDLCLYSLRNCNSECGRLPDGTEVELNGVILGHFESFHFIPTNPAHRLVSETQE